MVTPKNTLVNSRGNSTVSNCCKKWKFKEKKIAWKITYLQIRLNKKQIEDKFKEKQFKKLEEERRATAKQTKRILKGFNLKTKNKKIENRMMFQNMKDQI